jgi:hypothetical protein
MAGKRRGTGKPMQRHASAARRRERMQADLADATDVVARLTIAAEYLRGAMRRNPAAVREQAVENLIQQLVTAGDQLNQGVRK